MRRIAITDGRLRERSDEIGFPLAAQTLLSRCLELAATGVEQILLREQALAPQAFAQFAEELATALAGTPARLLLAGSPAYTVALAGQDKRVGVHLSGSDAHHLPALRAASPHLYVTVSCHLAGEVVEAARHGASAALFAPVFGKWVNGQQVAAAAGIAALRGACRAGSPLPVFALGGVDESNADACLAAGAAGIAAIRMFRWP